MHSHLTEYSCRAHASLAAVLAQIEMSADCEEAGDPILCSILDDSTVFSKGKYMCRLWHLQKAPFSSVLQSLRSLSMFGSLQSSCQQFRQTCLVGVSQV